MKHPTIARTPHLKQVVEALNQILLRYREVHMRNVCHNIRSYCLQTILYYRIYTYPLRKCRRIYKEVYKIIYKSPICPPITQSYPLLIFWCIHINIYSYILFFNGTFCSLPFIICFFHLPIYYKTLSFLYIYMTILYLSDILFLLHVFKVLSQSFFECY